MFFVFRMPFCSLGKKVFLYDEGGVTVKTFLMCLLMAITMLIVGCGGTDQPKNERAEKGEIVISARALTRRLAGGCGGRIRFTAH